MKIKLLPFNEAVKKIKEHDEILAEYYTDRTKVAGISKEWWKKLENEVLTVYDDTDADWYYNQRFAFPKCCCEVIENEIN